MVEDDDSDEARVVEKFIGFLFYMLNSSDRGEEYAVKSEFPMECGVKLRLFLLEGVLEFVLLWCRLSNSFNNCLLRFLSLCSFDMLLLLLKGVTLLGSAWEAVAPLKDCREDKKFVLEALDFCVLPWWLVLAFPAVATAAASLTFVAEDSNNIGCFVKPCLGYRWMDSLGFASTWIEGASKLWWTILLLLSSEWS